MKKKTFAYLLLLVLAVGLAVRLYRLDLRPMHHDEANQAYKFGQLLEKGEYRYDPADHHGPTLYYFNLPFAWLSGQTTFAELTEKTLRGATVFFGLLIILLVLAAGNNLKASEKFWAAVLLALSPALVYYSRFYIQETLFVAFSLAFVIILWRFVFRPDFRQGVWLGLAAGLLFATKETWLIVAGAAAASIVLLRIPGWLKNSGRRDEKGQRKVTLNLPAIKSALLPSLLAVVIFLAVSFLFYSSFFKHPDGFLDAFRALGGYLEKAAEPGWHRHGFWYYFSLLLYRKAGAGGPLFSEIPVLALALYGAVLSFIRLSRRAAENFRAYLTLFALTTALIYSAIPYKTPWNLLVFLAAFLVLAAVGFSHLLSLIKIRQAKIILAGALIIWSGWQMYLVNIYFHSYPANPYVYAQTSPDFMRLVSRVEELVSVSKEGREMPVKVIAPPEETWPIPWYLRKFSRVGYWTSSEQVEELEPAECAILSAGESRKRSEAELDSYVLQYYSLRPDVLMVLAVREDLWENYRLRKYTTPPGAEK
ncbi:MAG: TIGR03663 family protein [Candidatus Saccharicenans sp.]|nr:TIGR03663 family protein [Candidatus Saccharicenans sp.]